MNAAFFYGPHNIQIKKIEKFKPSENEFIIKILSCSVCSYDIRTFRNGSFKVSPPVILGHEICGEVVEGYEGKNFSIQPNTRVCVYPVIPCFECWYCKNKKFNLCINLKEIGSTINGGFAEYMVLPKRIYEIGGIVPVLDNVSNEEASLAEPLGCCINAINQIKNLEFDSISIIGDGPIGLMQLMLLKKQFNVNIAVIGKIQHRLEKAKKIGADLTINIDNINNSEEIDNRRITTVKKDKSNSIYTNDIIAKKIREIGGSSYSPNLIFVSNNNPNSIKMAFDLVNKNGKIVIFSGIKKNIENNHVVNNKSIGNARTFKKKDSTNTEVSSITKKNFLEIDPNFIHYNQVSLFGSFSSNPVNIKEAMDLINRGEIKISELITHRFKLIDIKKAFRVTEIFEGLKSTINKFE